MPSVPYLTVAWNMKGYVMATWTHDGVDIFGWYIECQEQGTSNYPVSYQTYNTALREYLIPQNSGGIPPLEANKTYTIFVKALSTSGHVDSRIATIANGTQVSHTFFDGTEYIWPSHESDKTTIGAHQYWLPSMDFTHIAHGQLPTDFLPATAIPLAVTGGVRFGSWQIVASTGLDPTKRTLPQLYGRPSGYTPPWTVAPSLPTTGTITGNHASSEWLSGATYVNTYKTIDPIQTEFNGQADYPSITDPQTGENWTRANVMSYWWGWTWYQWSSYTLYADDIFDSSIPGVRPRVETVDDGRINMMKVYVDYAFPPTYSDDPEPPPEEPPVEDPTGFSGIFSISTTGTERHDIYYQDVVKKIPDPTIRTALLGD